MLSACRSGAFFVVDRLSSCRRDDSYRTEIVSSRSLHHRIGQSYLAQRTARGGPYVAIGRTVGKERGGFTYRVEGSAGTFSQGIFRRPQTVGRVVSRRTSRYG